MLFILCMFFCQMLQSWILKSVQVFSEFICICIFGSSMTLKYYGPQVHPDWVLTNDLQIMDSIFHAEMLVLITEPLGTFNRIVSLRSILTHQN